MTSLVNTETGEIVETTALAPVNTGSEIAVTSYLAQARDWLARAVDETGPEQIAAAKAKIATAAEATKQLGLSKEIQLDAQEMVRRAEYALGKAIRKGQAEGVVRSQGEGSKDNLSDTRTKLRSPYDFATKHELHGGAQTPGIYDVAEMPSDDFDAAIDAAKAEGNLSRSNVARKAREASGAERTPSRRPLPDAFWTTLYDLGKKAESLHRLTQDDRWPANAKKLAARNRNELLRINDLVQQVINSLPEQESTHD